MRPAGLTLLDWATTVLVAVAALVTAPLWAPLLAQLVPPTAGALSSVENLAAAAQGGLGNTVVTVVGVVAWIVIASEVLSGGR